MQAYEPWSYRSELLGFLSKEGCEAVDIALLRIDAKFKQRGYWSAGPGRSRKEREVLYCDVYEALAIVIFKEHPTFDAALLTATIPRLGAAAVCDWKWDDPQVRLAPGSVQKWMRGGVSAWTANLLEKVASQRNRLAAVEVILELTPDAAGKPSIVGKRPFGPSDEHVCRVEKADLYKKKNLLDVPGLAAEMGVSQSTFHAWRSGKFTGPKRVGPATRASIDKFVDSI